MAKRDAPPVLTLYVAEVTLDVPKLPGADEHTQTRFIDLEMTREQSKLIIQYLQSRNADTPIGAIRMRVKGRLRL